MLTVCIQDYSGWLGQVFWVYGVEVRWVGWIDLMDELFRSFIVFFQYSRGYGFLVFELWVVGVMGLEEFVSFTVYVGWSQGY